MEIMKLLPVGKDYLWGGTKLRDDYGKKIDMTPLAETWECSIHPDGLSIIANGEYEGLSLANVLTSNPNYLGNKLEDNSELPILVKFIDARKNLSVQVHPDDQYAQEHENQNGKTEMWYIVDAEEDSCLIYGFAHPVTADLIETAVESGNIEKHLQKIKVNKGDVFYIPAGLVHGIGAGTLIAEIQENSNVTYRVYDYNRLDKNNDKRELHLNKAIDVMNMNATADYKQKNRLIHYYPGCSREELCRCRYFITERIQVKTAFSFSVIEASFQVVLCVDGDGQIEMADDTIRPVRFKKGDCLFLPANIGRCFILGNCTLLKTRC